MDSIQSPAQVLGVEGRVEKGGSHWLASLWDPRKGRAPSPTRLSAFLFMGSGPFRFDCICGEEEEGWVQTLSLISLRFLLETVGESLTWAESNL